jgi:hypothetical protein
MRITIKSIVDEKLKKIQFSSDFGDATAIWIGDLPVYGKDYFVEMDTTGILTFGQDIDVSFVREFKIMQSNDEIIFNAQLEEIVEAGATLRLGDSLVLIETRGTPFSTDSFVKVTTNVDNVTLHSLI